MDIFITGATGFIGSLLVARLRNSHNVAGLSRKKKKDCFVGDITKYETLRKIGKKASFDVIYHLAAELDETLPYRVLYNVNVKGTENVIRLARHWNARLIYLGPIGVLGPTRVSADEDSPYNPETKYEKSKCEAEKLLLMYSQDESMPITILRSPIVYGENKYWLKIIKVIRNNKFPILGTGKNFFHLTYIENLVQALEKALLLKKYGEVFHIADEKAYRLDEVYGMIADYLDVDLPSWHYPVLGAKVLASLFELSAILRGKEPLLTRAWVDRITRNRIYDISKAKKELNYEPKYDFKTGIKEVIDSFKEKEAI